MTEVNISIEDSASTPEKVVKIVHISGQLDESNVDEKIKEIYTVVDANPKNLHLIFDFSSLDYMNSKSIGYLIDLYGKLTENGGKVLIAGAKTNIMDILQVVGLTQLIQSFDTVKAAAESLQNSTAETAPTPAPAPVPAPAPTAQIETAPQEPAASTPTAPAETAPQEPAPATPAPSPVVNPSAAQNTAPATPESPASAAPEAPAVAPNPESSDTYKLQ